VLKAWGNALEEGCHNLVEVQKNILGDLWEWDTNVLGELEKRIDNVKRELEKCRLWNALEFTQDMNDVLLEPFTRDEI
jgi:hypothetical protein